jgi:uncharacterized protein YndB with AHSA1/START domain
MGGVAVWFECAHSQLDFFDVAPFRVVTEVILSSPPHVVFDTFADDAAWPRWFTEVRVQRWLGAETHGVGARREVTFSSFGVAVPVRERFLAWQPGKRFAFSMDAIGLPVLHAAGEDYRLEALGRDRTRLRWLFCYDPALPGQMVDPALRLFLRRVLARAAGRLSSVVQKRGRTSRSSRRVRAS